MKCVSSRCTRLIGMHRQAAPGPEPFVFAGGNSHRDYEPLVAAARSLPDIRFLFATNLLEGRADLPPNVRAGQLPVAEFARLLRAAAVVVFPLRRRLRRAAGQQTHLNAMLAGVPVVVTDSPGVSDHVQNGVTGLVVDATSEDYVQALRSVLAPANGPSVAHMCRAAAADVRTRFAYARHLRDLLGVLDEFTLGPVPAESEAIPV